MTKLKLGPIEDDTPVKISLDLPAALHRDLIAYGQALGSETGTKAIEPVKLIAPMLSRFIETDRGFVRGKRTGRL